MSSLYKSYYAATFLPNMVKLIQFTEDQGIDPCNSFHGVWTFTKEGKKSYREYGSEHGSVIQGEYTSSHEGQSHIQTASYMKEINGLLIYFQRTRKIEMDMDFVQVIEDGIVVFSDQRVVN